MRSGAGRRAWGIYFIAFSRQTGEEVAVAVLEDTLSSYAARLR